MSEDEPPVKKRGCLARGLVALVIGFIALLFVTPTLEGDTWRGELFYHLTVGCALHANRALSHFAADLPRLMASAIMPSLATVVALWGAHRLVLWWRLANGKDGGWRFAHTALAGSLVLLGAAAAIALSGVLHELAWLPQGKIVRSNMRSPLTEAVSDARQLGFCLFEYENEHGRYPSSLQDLGEFAPPGTLKRLMFVDLDSPGPPEPFVFVRSGESGSGNPSRLLVVSPLMSEDGVFIALKMDNSVTRLNAAKFAEEVKSAHGDKPERK